MAPTLESDGAYRKYIFLMLKAHDGSETTYPLIPKIEEICDSAIKEQTYLTSEERDIILQILKNAVKRRQNQWQNIFNALEKHKKVFQMGHLPNNLIIEAMKEKMKAEDEYLNSIYDEMRLIVEKGNDIADRLLNNCVMKDDAVSKATYIKFIADNYRYLCTCRYCSAAQSYDEQCKRKTETLYKRLMECVQKIPEHSEVRLGSMLNYACYMNEVKSDSVGAMHLAEEAISGINDEQNLSADSTALFRLCQFNADQWRDGLKGEHHSANPWKQIDGKKERGGGDRTKR